jgi:hypothetical protein
MTPDFLHSCNRVSVNLCQKSKFVIFTPKKIVIFTKLEGFYHPKVNLLYFKYNITWYLTTKSKFTLFQGSIHKSKIGVQKKPVTVNFSKSGVMGLGINRNVLSST